MRMPPLVCVGLGLLLASGCGKKSGGDDQPEPEPEQPKPGKRVDPATAGTIEGVVTFTGTPPENEEMPIADPACRENQKTTPRRDVILVTDGKLANAFVYIADGLAEYGFDTPTTEAVIDQVGCVYTPLVVGVQVGQPLTFVNSDPVLHNVNTEGEKNRGTNFAMPQKGQRKSKTYKKPEIMVRAKCDVHPWMRAYVGVVAHPFFAVTGADGAFTFAGVPPGEYTVGLWHEKLGTQTQKVTLAAKGSARAEFATMLK